MSLVLPPTLLGEDARLLKLTKSTQRFFRGDGKERYLSKSVFYLNEQPIKLTPSPFSIGLRKFLRTHRFLIGRSNYSLYYNKIDYTYYSLDPVRRLSVFRPRYIGVLVFKGYSVSIKKKQETDNAVLPPMYLTRHADGTWIWIASITPVNRCPRCGSTWSSNHSCNETVAAFHHIVMGKGKDLWQHVYFRCPAMQPNTRLLFVTYDIETYTSFELKDKRLQPFMLCFKLSGHPDLVETGHEIAKEDDTIGMLNGGYYWIDPRPGEVARRFRTFRHRLQLHFARDLVRRFYRCNEDYYRQVMRDGQYASIYDIPHELFTHPAAPLSLSESFFSVDIVILGHNICKFDELLLATELLEQRHEFPQAVRCVRAFMPRVGRLLFNDIKFSLPNPLYKRKDASRVTRWASGRVSVVDDADVYVRFMVRDTCQLTSGAKLSRAATAYALDLGKGTCPYEAINEHFSFGDFEKDEDGFPVSRYWEQPSVLLEQKNLWQQAHPEQAYDIVQACLEYCMQDVLVTEKLAHVLYENYDAYFSNELEMTGPFNIFERPTIPSNTHALWKQIAFTAYVKEQKRKGRRKIHPDYLAELYSPHKTMFRYIRQALRGGRCYPTVLGPFSAPVYVFDICGMYASALTHPMPHGMPLHPDHVRQEVDKLNELLRSTDHLSYFDSRIKPSILKIDAHPPRLEYLDPLPPLCSRRGGRLVWTNESLYDEVVVILDVITLHNRGWRVTVRQDPMNVVFPEWKTLCAEYVGKNIAAKEKADREKNEVLRSISKMLSNALYGAFATNMDAMSIKFEQDLTEGDLADIYDGTKVVKHVTLLNDPSLMSRELSIPNSPWSADGDVATDPLLTDDAESDEGPSLSEVDEQLEAAVGGEVYIPSDDHAHYAKASETVFKPLRLVDADGAALTVLHLERLDKLVDNHRYATQLACFVLGWSRAFFSEWSDIVHGPDRGIHPHSRPPRSLYGDTDSLFVTASGYERMRTLGAHRLKTPTTRLTFDPEKPDLYWVCECDIKCKKCGSDTYSSEAVFLAPKLYGLKDAVCINPDCGHVGVGKIRSKGHRQAELIYETLMKCWYRHEAETLGAHPKEPDLYTRRTIFKTTLLNKVSRYDPFTIHTEQLVRILRPWKDLTLYEHNGLLHPYNNLNPNPRTVGEKIYREDASARDPLAPLSLLRSDGSQA
ncbi:DNA polymerase [Pigeon adenovirus 2a]|nr:DNA polymerase [Pigeon adenovirus 2a]